MYVYSAVSVCVIGVTIRKSTSAAYLNRAATMLVFFPATTEGF